MKVLHIIPTLGVGGAEKMLVDMVESMVNRNINVEVLVLSQEDNFYASQIEILGVPLYYGKKDKVYHYSHIKTIRSFLKKNFDIVHAHLFAPQLFLAISKQTIFTNSKFITTEHSTHNRRRENIIFKPIDKWIYNQYDTIITITKGTSYELNKYLPSTLKKTIVIENGVNLEQYKNAIPLGREKLIPNYKEKDILILMVAAMRIQKDHETLIRSSKYLPSNYHIIFVGDGERMKELQEYSSHYNHSNIHFLGRRSDIPSIMKTCDVFVLSSHWEGFGLVVIEAMAAGIPVIASNVNGLKEVINNSGLLFDKGNEYELSQKIIQLAKNNQLRKKLINKGFDNIKRYEIKTTVDSYLNIYKQSCFKNDS